jgi:hypothetical protein
MRTFLAGAALVTMLLASVAAAAPGPATKQVRATSGPVHALAADGDRAAFVVEGRFKECLSVMLWEPSRRRAVALQAARTCETNDRGGRTGPPAVALARTRAAWLQISGGNTLETIVRTATLARPKPVWIAAGYADDGVAGRFARRPAGDGTLLAFTIESRCHPDHELYPCPPGHEPRDVVQATVWRVGGRSRCPNAEARESIRCTPVAKAEGELTVLAVDAGRIVVRTESGVRLLTAGGRVLQDISVTPGAAALSGTRLAVRTESAVEVYNRSTGEMDARFAVSKDVRLQDLAGGILVTASGGTVTLRRLADGRTSMLRVGRTALAQLEPSGLFVAGARRVTFMPMRDVARRLARARS